MLSNLHNIDNDMKERSQATNCSKQNFRSYNNLWCPKKSVWSAPFYITVTLFWISALYPRAMHWSFQNVSIPGFTINFGFDVKRCVRRPRREINRCSRRISGWHSTDCKEDCGCTGCEGLQCLAEQWQVSAPGNARTSKPDFCPSTESMQQEVDHVHFHVIPKPNATEGLGIEWPAQKPEKADLQKILDDIKGRL